MWKSGREGQIKKIKEEIGDIMSFFRTSKHGDHIYLSLNLQFIQEKVGPVCT